MSRSRELPTPPAVSLATCAAVLLLALLVALPAWALDGDADGDGLPDAVEKLLGTDPGSADQLVRVASDKTREQGDRVGKDNYSPGLDLTGLWLGNAGGDRYLWRVDFAAPYESANSGLIIYLDADGDPKTGRRDMGCEYMIVSSQGAASVRAFTPEGVESAQGCRAAVLGASLYLCADLKLKQVDGKSSGSVLVLHETKQPYASVDSIDKVAFSGPGESTRAKYIIPAEETRSRGMDVTWGFRALEKIKQDPANLLIHAWDCDLQGYELNIQNEYVNRHVRAVGGGAHTVTTKVPRSGRYYLGFFTYQRPGRQNLLLRLGEKEIGLAVASEGNNRQCLFLTHDAVDVKKGEALQVEGLYGSPLVEDLILLPRKPALAGLVRELTDLAGRPALTLDGRLVGEVTFVTTWPAVCRLSGAGAVQSDEEPLANHRFWLPDVKPGERLTATVETETPEGEKIRRQVAFVAALAPPRGTVSRARLPLSCANDYPDALKAWPVSQGLPFPCGALVSADHLRLQSAAGTEIPLQVTVLGYWPDYSIKWVLLDFQTDLPAKETSAFVLEYGTEVRRAKVTRPLDLEVTAAGATVDTGVLKAELSSARPGLMGRVYLDRNGDGRFAEDELVSGPGIGESAIAVAGATDSSAQQPAKLTVLRRGPLHCIVRVEGEIRPGEARYGDAVDLHFYAGKPWVGTNHTFVNRDGRATFTKLDSLSLSQPLNLGGAVRGQFGAAATRDVAATAGALAGPATLWQGFDDAYRITGALGTSEGRRAANWADETGRAAGVTVAVRYLWQLYPKSLTLRPDGIEVGLMPRFAPGAYRVSKEGELEDKLYYYLKDDAYKLKLGVSKRHELLWVFHGPQEGPAAAEAAAFDEPPVLKADPNWYCASKAFGDILPSSPQLGGLFATYENAVGKAAEGFLSSRERGREYGMLNFGDWWGERGRNWGNIEYDSQYAFYLQFVRSGDERFLRIGEQASRHNHDVDMIWAGDPHQIGKVYAHCIGHTGGYYDHMINNQGSPSGGCSVTHSWCEGYLADYFLSGDPRGLEAATALTDVYDKYKTANYDFDICRDNGWHLILTMGQYRATSDPFYLNAARIILARTKEREAPGGGWVREMMPGHCYCLPRHRGEAAFMLGILLSGLGDYNQVAHDPDVDRMIAQAAHWLIRECWVPERKSMRYTSCPVSSSGGGLSELITEGMMAGYLSRPDKVLGEVVRTGTVEAVRRVDGFGKSFTQQIRRTPAILYQFAQADLDNYDFAPGQTVRVILRAPTDTGFGVTLRPRGEGRLGGKAVLLKGEQAIAEVALDRRPAVTMEVKSGAGAGLYTLSVAPAGDVPWDVDCDLDKQIVDCGSGVRFGPGVRLPSYMVFVPPAAKTVLTLSGAAAGYRARVVGPDGKTALETRFGKAPVNLALDPARGLRGLCRLDLTACPGAFSVKLAGPLPYLSYWPGQMFAPGEPVPAFEVRGSLGPGGSPEVSLDASATSDADGDITEYRWDFGDGARGLGKTVGHRYARSGSYTVTLTVADKLGAATTARRGVSIPPEWVFALASGGAVALEAERFSGQGKGEVSVVQRVGANGAMVTRWEANAGHWLEWKFEAPREGKYALVLRYCNGTAEGSRREVTVDGKALGGGAWRRSTWPTPGASRRIGTTSATIVCRRRRAGRGVTRRPRCN